MCLNSRFGPENQLLGRNAFGPFPQSSNSFGMVGFTAALPVKGGMLGKAGRLFGTFLPTFARGFAGVSTEFIISQPKKRLCQMDHRSRIEYLRPISEE